MSRGIRIGLIIAVAVVLTYPMAAWVIGIVVEKQNEADEQKRLADAPYVVRVKRDYQRGIFSSVVRLTYQIALPMAKGASDKGAFGPWHLTTRCVIHHGPLPRLQTFALATADCDLQLPPEMGQDVTAALAGKSPLDAYVRYGWFGGSTTTFTSPAFTLKLDNRVTVSWQGLTGKLEAGRDLATWSGTFTTPGFTVDHAATHAEIGPMTFTADMRRVFDTLHVGTASVKAAGATVHSAEPDKDLALKGVAVSAVSSQDGDYVNSAVELTVDAMEAKEFSATRVGYAFRLKHAHGPSLAALTRAMRDAQREALAANQEAFQSKLRDSFRAHGIDVLVHDPVLEIPRIGFVTPEGEARLSAKLSAPGLTREDLQGPGFPGAILRHLEAEADLAVSTALLKKMLSGNQNGAAALQRLATLQRQGYVKEAAAQYTIHVTYEHGKTVVNALPFPPVGPH